MNNSRQFLRIQQQYSLIWVLGTMSNFINLDHKSHVYFEFEVICQYFQPYNNIVKRPNY